MNPEEFRGSQKGRTWVSAPVSPKRLRTRDILWTSTPGRADSSIKLGHKISIDMGIHHSEDDDDDDDKTAPMVVAMTPHASLSHSKRIVASTSSSGDSTTKFKRANSINVAAINTGADIETSNSASTSSPTSLVRSPHSGRSKKTDELSPLNSPIMTQIRLSNDSRLMALLSIEGIAVDLLTCAYRFDALERKTATSDHDAQLKEIDALKLCVFIQGNIPNSWHAIEKSLWHPLLRALVAIDKQRSVEMDQLFGVFKYPGNSNYEFMLILNEEQYQSKFMCIEIKTNCMRRIIGLPQHDGVDAASH